MSIKYEKVPVQEGFLVKIEYEHGDADATTYETVQIKDEESLIAFVKTLKACADELEEFLSNGDDPTEEFQKRAEKAKIPLVSDIVYEGNIAYMNINSVVFVNANGESFNVTVD